MSAFALFLLLVMGGNMPLMIIQLADRQTCTDNMKFMVNAMRPAKGVQLICYDVLRQESVAAIGAKPQGEQQ